MAEKIRKKQTNNRENRSKSFFRTAQNSHFNMGEVGPVDLGNGHVLIAPHDGILMLDKETLHPETKQIPVALSAIALEGKANYAVNHLTHLTMASNERSIAIRFAALDYRGNEDIRYPCGFSDPKYFAKSFKSETGKTPTEYRLARCGLVRNNGWSGKMNLTKTLQKGRGEVAGISRVRQVKRR